MLMKLALTLFLLTLVIATSAADLTKPVNDTRITTHLRDQIAYLKEAGKFRIFLLGDSLFGNFDQGAWDLHLAKYKVFNSAVFLNSIQNVLYQVENGLLAVCPKRFFLWIGTNNIPYNTGADIVNGTLNLVQRVLVHCPVSAIDVLSIYPRRDDAQMFLEKKSRFVVRSLMNKYLLNFSGRVSFLDIRPLFTLDNELINQTYYQGDGVHPNQLGYGLLGKALASRLASLFPDV